MSDFSDLLAPLIKRFAEDASPLNIVLFLLLFAALGIIWQVLRDRRKRIRELEDDNGELVDKLIALSEEARKAGAASAKVIEAGNVEATEERRLLSEILNNLHRQVEERRQ